MFIWGVLDPRPIPSPDGAVEPGAAAVVDGCELNGVVELRKGFRDPEVGDPMGSGIVALRCGVEMLNDDWVCGVDPNELVNSDGAGLGPAENCDWSDDCGVCCACCVCSVVEDEDGGGARLYRARILFLSIRPVFCGASC